jgi:ABC-type Mn2+/Zn2+ transport systems, permease components
MIRDALLLQLGYNATLVTLGATLLGMAAGVGGTFLFLRKRALVSDAISHATLPGVALAFMVMVALGGTGRNLVGLLTGAALSAAVGLLLVSWLGTRTRLAGGCGDRLRPVGFLWLRHCAADGDPDHVGGSAGRA